MSTGPSRRKGGTSERPATDATVASAAALIEGEPAVAASYPPVPEAPTGYVDVADARLAVYDHGAPKGRLDAETVVLVHGFPDNHEVWDRVSARLSARYRVVTYDSRGCGRSTGRGTWLHSDAYRLPNVSRDFKAVIDFVSPERPVHLVGHDWGSIASWESATSAWAPERIASFTTISGPCLDHVGHFYRDYYTAKFREATREAGGEAPAGDAPPPAPAAAPTGLAALGPTLVATGALLRLITRSWYILLIMIPGLAEAAFRFMSTRIADGIRVRERLDDSVRHPTAASVAVDGAGGLFLYRRNILQRFVFPRDRRTDVRTLVIQPTRDKYVSQALTEGVAKYGSDISRIVVEGKHWLIVTQPDLVAGLIAKNIEGEKVN